MNDVDDLVISDTFYRNVKKEKCKTVDTEWFVYFRVSCLQSFKKNLPFSGYKIRNGRSYVSTPNVFGKFYIEKKKKKISIPQSENSGSDQTLRSGVH